MAASPQGDTHVGHIAKRSTCLACDLMASPEGGGVRDEGRREK